MTNLWARMKENLFKISIVLLILINLFQIWGSFDIGFPHSFAEWPQTNWQMAFNFFWEPTFELMLISLVFILFCVKRKRFVFPFMFLYFLTYLPPMHLLYSQIFTSHGGMLFPETNLYWVAVVLLLIVSAIGSYQWFKHRRWFRRSRRVTQQRPVGPWRSIVKFRALIAELKAQPDNEARTFRFFYWLFLVSLLPTLLIILRHPHIEVTTYAKGMLLLGLLIKAAGLYFAYRVNGGANGRYFFHYLFPIMFAYVFRVYLPFVLVTNLVFSVIIFSFKPAAVLAQTGLTPNTYFFNAFSFTVSAALLVYWVRLIRCIRALRIARERRELVEVNA